MLAKSMQKHAGRAKEKILQNLGKVDRTADEIFDDHLNNFNRQQVHANRLQKEFNNYIRCVRAIQGASKSLMDAICELYEPQWGGFEALQAQTAASESLWQDFAHKLADQVLIPLSTYTGQFPEMKKKIEKRNRKLIDYDGQRHSFQNLQANANKRKDDAKLTKGREQLEEARRTYEILNTELHDELPALYDSRILFFVTNLQTLFGTEQVFHAETAKIFAELEAIVDNLATESQRGSNTLRKQLTSNAIKAASPVQSPVKQINSAATMNNTNYQNQITTNGASNANSPTSTTSSQSQQQQQQQQQLEHQQQELESRPDSLSSVSSTPESTPENQKAPPTVAAANATNNNATSVPTPSSSPKLTATSSKPKQPSYQDLSAVVKDEMESVAATPLSVQCSNTNEMSNAQAQVKLENLNDKAMNNSSIMESSTTSVTNTTTTKTISQHSTEPLNGNGNSNGNDVDSNIGDGNNIAKTIKDETKTIAKATTTTAPETETETETASATKINNGNIEDETKNASGDATTTDLPPGVLYRVKATYGYVKEDVDELSFEIGDIIRVIEYDDPEDQEEGWLMGQKEGTNEKGLFPANFTRPI